MKKMAALFLALVLVFSLVACSSSPTGGSTPVENTGSNGTDTSATNSPNSNNSDNSTVYTLSVGTVVTDKTVTGKALEQIKATLYERSNGTIVLDIFYSSTLGGASELAEGLLLGTVDIGQVSAAVLSNYCPAIDILNLPYIFTDRAHAKAAIEMYGDEILEGVEETFGTPLGIFEQGWRHIMNTKRSITTLEDFKGLTVRVQEGQVYYDTYNALGCIPSTIAIGELVTALQQGVCDAEDTALATTVNQQHYEFCKYLTVTNHMFGTSVMILGNAAKEKLPEDKFNLLVEVFEEYKWLSMELGEEDDGALIQTLKDNGVEVSYLSPEETARIQEAVSSVWDSYSNRELIDAIVDLGK